MVGGKPSLHPKQATRGLPAIHTRSRISPLRSPHRISLVGNHKGCPYKCNGVDIHEGCPRKCCGGEGAFPRGSVHHHRTETPQRSAGQKLPFPPQGLFAEKQPPRRLSGALLFRPFSWANKKKASPKAWEGRGGRFNPSKMRHPPPARLRAGALGLPTPPQGGSNGDRLLSSAPGVKRYSRAGCPRSGETPALPGA